MLHSFLKLLYGHCFPFCRLCWGCFKHLCWEILCQSILPFSWDVPNLLTSFVFVFNFLTSSFSLWCEIQWVSWKMNDVMYHDYHATQNTFTTLKKIMYISLSNSLPKTLVIKDFYCCFNFTFSRISYNLKHSAHILFLWLSTSTQKYFFFFPFMSFS